MMMMLLRKRRRSMFLIGTSRQEPRSTRWRRRHRSGSYAVGIGVLGGGWFAEKMMIANDGFTTVVFFGRYNLENGDFQVTVIGFTVVAQSKIFFFLVFFIVQLLL